MPDNTTLTELGQENRSINLTISASALVQMIFFYRVMSNTPYVLTRTRSGAAALADYLERILTGEAESNYIIGLPVVEVDELHRDERPTEACKWSVEWMGGQEAHIRDTSVWLVVQRARRQNLTIPNGFIEWALYAPIGHSARWSLLNDDGDEGITVSASVEPWVRA